MEGLFLFFGAHGKKDAQCESQEKENNETNQGGGSDDSEWCKHIVPPEESCCKLFIVVSVKDEIAAEGNDVTIHKHMGKVVYKIKIIYKGLVNNI